MQIQQFVNMEQQQDEEQQSIPQNQEEEIEHGEEG